MENLDKNTPTFQWCLCRIMRQVLITHYRPTALFYMPAFHHILVA